MKDIFRVHHEDARNIDKIIKNKIVDVTITSPPYFDLKDYGSDNQIGYGQDYDAYLNDLKIVFKKVYNVTKESGTLWVIIDAYRREGEVVPLPFDFSNKLREVGWKLKEVIIWGKDRTVPWAHKGQMRNLFEYILVFSKSDDFNFYMDEVRDYETLKKWWVKYPERYNPKGKTPDAIWNFDIPTQGSWGKGYIRHFCPLPEEMIEQMLKLTTKEGDVVLDCFSGSGSVLSKALNMNRRYIGFELNLEYIDMFHNYIQETNQEKSSTYLLNKKNKIAQNRFEKLINDLRALKYARLIIKKLNAEGLDSVSKIYVKRTYTFSNGKRKFLKVNYLFFIEDKSRKIEVAKKVDEITQKAPFSKFGIESSFHYVNNFTTFISKIESNSKTLYLYNYKATHKFIKKIKSAEINKEEKSQVIISPIKVNLDEKDYE